ncbi:MAG: ribonuclease HII [Crinalium sp.]
MLDCVELSRVFSSSSGFSEGLICPAGTDDSGSGALAGPVLAASVIIPKNERTRLIRAGVCDSKAVRSTKATEKTEYSSAEEIRLKLANLIKDVAISWAVGEVSVEEYNELKNKNDAPMLAMQRSVLGLSVRPTLVLVDGANEIPGIDIPQQTFIGGDVVKLAISAASIIAKSARDTIMNELAKKHTGYYFERNKGYGGVRHKDHEYALYLYGVSPIHRDLPSITNRKYWEKNHAR